MHLASRQCGYRRPPCHTWARRHWWSLAGTVASISCTESRILQHVGIPVARSTIELSLEAVHNKKWENVEKRIFLPSSDPVVYLLLRFALQWPQTQNFMVLLLRFIHTLSITSRCLPANDEIISLAQVFSSHGCFFRAWIQFSSFSWIVTTFGIYWWY